jgi:two-component system LytT family response regulator
MNFDEVLYIKGRKNYTQFVTEKRNYLILGTIKNIESLLPNSRFCRVHKSYVVPLARIKKFDREMILLIGKNEKDPDIIIPIGRVYSNELMKRLVLIPQLGKMNSNLTKSVRWLMQEAI